MLRWEDDQSYHRRRAEEEFHRACEAKHHRAAAAHFKLFDLHVACLLTRRVSQEASDQLICRNSDPVELILQNAHEQL